MAITVDGYGAIHKGNAKEIYLAYNRGEIELNKAQETKCKSFLSPEDIDEIAYDEQVQSKEGAEKINTENTDNKGGAATATAQVAGTATALTGTIIAVCGGLTKYAPKAATNGFVSLATAIVAAAGAAVAMAFAFMFDPALKDRLSHSNNAGNDNQTMDGYSEGLAGSMEMMNEDTELYKEQSAQLTTVKNEQTSRGAELQMEYDTAMAMGDKAGAEKAKAEMQKLAETDNSELEDGLKETGEGLEEYRTMNLESSAVAQSGQTVSDFLKDGKPMATVAMTSAVMASAATVLLGIAAIVGAIPKIWALAVPVDGAPAIASAVLWTASTAMMGTTAGIMFKKYGEENQCGNNGEEMQTHVDNLTSMVAQQTQYTEDTAATYAETDEASAESQAEAGKQAAGATAENKDNLNGKPKGEKQSETATNTPKNNGITFDKPKETGFVTSFKDDNKIIKNQNDFERTVV